MHALDLDGTVRSLVAQQLDVAPERLTRDVSLDALGLDDGLAFALLYAVEDALDVRFPDDFLDGVYTYGELTSAVRMAIGA